MSDARIAKPETGIGRKPPDYFVVPLCGRHHRQQHEGSEREFWWCEQEPILKALALYAVSGDYEAGLQIVKA
jgi:hypothetical protein